MATLAQIKTAVDNRLASLWSAIQTKEDAYASVHNGRYWQGLKTHSIDPSEGNTALPTVGAACPTDQLGQPWPNAILTTSIEMAINIDIYDGPLGVGYQVTVTVAVLGNVYTRTQQIGPETWRNRVWQQVS
jgi:hypothetical protein